MRDPLSRGGVRARLGGGPVRQYRDGVAVERHPTGARSVTWGGHVYGVVLAAAALRDAVRRARAASRRWARAYPELAD